MRVTNITAIAITGLAGMSSAARGMLKSCTTFSFSGLPDPNEGTMMLSAWCSHNKQNYFSQLDLNKCFGWSADNCGFTYPPAGGFTGSVHSCSNTHSGDNDFGNSFGCFGPCSKGNGDAFNIFALDEYVGNDNGHLAC